MCDVSKDKNNLEVENETQYNDEEILECSSEELINQIGVQEELKRIELQDNPISKIPKEFKNGETYKEITEQAYVIGESLKILLGYGVDYNNALAISSNLIQNKVNINLANIQQIQIQGQVL